ncbi:hypothetical protein [Mediterraneibacter gnavus]|uniref:hypothetical protein n=1 Tax=Mediterraneibacter gnavus TaxID=33038 RepID=UPI0034ACBFC9
MAEIKLFDTWTFQEEMPEPFSRFLQKEGLRKTTTMVECLSQYNQGRQATLHPPHIEGNAQYCRDLFETNRRSSWVSKRKL